MTDIEIYTRPGCGYCEHVKRLLTGKGLAFVEYDVYANPAFRKQMQQRARQQTFPQLFIKGEPVGGYEQLATIEPLLASL